MEKIRKVGKTLVWVLLIGPFAIAPLICLFNLILVIAYGRSDLLSQYFSTFMVVTGICGGILTIIYMVVYRAGKAGKDLEPSKKPEPSPDGDMSDVAGVPRREPWQGL